jgi:diguanylate cyclase (GGDEF)-like protein
MEAKDLLRELKRTVDELAAFSEIGKTLTSTLDIREVLRLIMQRVEELLRAKNWSLLLVDEQHKELYVELAVGKGAEKLRQLRLPLEEGIAGWAAREGEPVLVPDVSADGRFSRRFDEMTGFTTRSVLAVPLRSKARTLGVIELVHSPEEGAGGSGFTEADVRTLASIADYAAIALENARNFQRLEELTVVDDHTGLYNSRHLHRQLELEVARSGRFGRALSVIFLDLDHFKGVNDRHGHQSGSAMLREVGQVLKGNLRAIDVPVRYGGDEFVILLPETDRAQALLVASRLRSALKYHRFLEPRGLSLAVTASFGLATFPVDGRSGEEIMRQADAAMYRVKEGGRDGIAAAGEPVPPRGTAAKLA